MKPFPNQTSQSLVAATALCIEECELQVLTSQQNVRSSFCISSTFIYSVHTMSTTGHNSNTSRNGSNGWWTFRRHPKAPGYPHRLRNRIILGILLVVAIVGVSVGVVLFKNGKENETTAERPTPTIPSVVNEFLKGLPPYSKELASTNASSPQAKALAWLETDTQYNDYRYVYRLNQRYVMAVLYYSFGERYIVEGDSWWNSPRWLSNDNECTWINQPQDQNSCTEASRMSGLDLRGYMDGSIPAELELLTDVECMGLAGIALSGVIPSEL
jgi:hypothetical protein